ncbi:hypothetical protein O181_015638 [Austropuccinia psidii MF-1]|uniref:Uncharacterized protein n=1 Tax=Austropuccinia psidii MF-1 TaxID=1389203 RepID=A0A9Q3C2U5_9BASI|nr:hypothetical protein [Austropuccinia psidii MF-1]
MELSNTPDNPSYAPSDEEPQIPIEGINITYIRTEFFEEVREIYKKDKSYHILTSLLEKDCKDAALADPLDYIWKNLMIMEDYIYLMSAMTTFILEIFLKTEKWNELGHVLCGHLGEQISLSTFKVMTGFKKANKATGKGFGLIIHIQEPSNPWKVVHMDWVTALPHGGEKCYNACLVIVNRYSKTQIFSPCHEDETSMDKSLLIWNRVISHSGLFKNAISDRDPKFTLALWTNSHSLLGTKLSFSTAYYPQEYCGTPFSVGLDKAVLEGEITGKQFSIAELIL